MKNFEINCDMGELMGNDRDIMPYIDSCSIACGGHIGDEQSVADTIEIAQNFQVKVGAHPSFPDRKNFGRKFIQLSAAKLYGTLMEQVNLFYSICKQQSVPMDHIKPHGALYNLAAQDPETAGVIVKVAGEFDGATLLAPWNSAVHKQANKENIDIRYEAFADRRYKNDGNLVSRSNKLAVIQDPETAVQQVSNIINTKMLKTLDGHTISIRAETFCVHGDNPNIIGILKQLKKLQNGTSRT